MTGAGETLRCFTTVLEGDALLKKQIAYFDCKFVTVVADKQKKQ